MSDDVKAGIKSPGVTTGKADPAKARIARKATGAGGFGMGPRSREAGMLLDTTQQTAPYTSGTYMDTYRSSYAFGLGDRSGTYDIPTYFAQMNEQNGGLLYWPVTLREKYSWYRYWARSDAYIGRALELLSDLPMSKLTLNMPKMEGKKKLKDEIYRFFTYQAEVLNLFDLCQSILWEWNMIGNVYVFHEWDEKKKMWSRAVMLPPEEVFVFQYPFADNSRVEYRPERLISLIKDGGAGGSSKLPDGSDGLGDVAVTDSAGDEKCDKSNIETKIVEYVPKELKEMVKSEGCIVMDTDPTTGSFVHHVARRRSPYMDLGVSVLERVLVPMLQKEHFRYTQLSLASRNMTPKNLITAPGLMPAELNDLRTQVDLSYLDPEYSIITNYEVTWEQIGADNRLLQLDSEYERIENQVFAGLGVTRELLTGEGTFSGNKITVEILNSMFLLTREVLKNYIEKQLFIPICEAKGWYDEDSNGVKEYWYPKIGFNRLTIRDNAEVFDSLFQLYQKGSIPVDIIYELFNLNADEIDVKLYEDLFTVKDSNFNRTIEEIASESGRKIVENSNAAEKIAKYLKLDYSAPAEGEDGFGGGGFGDGFGGGGDEGGSSFDFGDGGADQGGQEEPESGEESQESAPEGNDEGGASLSDSDADSMADSIADKLPDGSSDEEIEKVVDEVSSAMDEEE